MRPTRFLPPTLLCLLIAFHLFALSPRAQAAGDLKVFAGKYTGVLVVAQGTATRLVASGSPTVTASRKSAKFVIKGTMNNTGFTQTIALGANGSAKISSVIPGGTGSFQAQVKGTYKVRGKKVIVSAPLSGGLSGKFQMEILFSTYGSTLTISTKVALNSGDPVYVTIIGS